jgi:hypothetical protein
VDFNLGEMAVVPVAVVMQWTRVVVISSGEGVKRTSIEMTLAVLLAPFVQV